jgi:hypothetical protein
MKFSAIVAAGLAAVATAAPAKVERSAFDLGQFNNLNGFGNLDLNYLLAINNLNLDLFGQLALNQNFNLLGFQGLFQQNAAFDLQSVLAVQQLLDIQQFAQLGLLNGFDLGGLGLQQFGFGVLQNGVGNLGLNQFIDASFIPQIQSVVSQQGMFFSPPVQAALFVDHPSPTARPHNPLRFS